MKILLTGGTGFVGRELGILLTEKGHEVHCLCRNPDKESQTNTYPAKYFKWDGDKELPPEESLKNIDAIVHLAGENIAAKRWTNDYKKKLIDSRVQSTQNIFKAFKKYNIKPSIFIGTSAVGYYGDRGDELLNEKSAKGRGFLSDLCEKWENAADECDSLNIRRCILRFGLVISELGGILDETIQLSHRGGLSRLSFSGKQWMSWIELNDLCHLIVWCLENKQVNGIYNAVSGTPIQNKDFVKAINSTLKNITLPAVPSPLLKLVLGEKSTLLLSSQKLAESRATQEGFVFKNKNFYDILTNTFPHWKSGQYLYTTKLWLPYDINSVFSFFKDENNLEKITPKTLGFKIISKSTPKIQTGSIIKYRIRIHGIPVVWKTKISEFMEPNSFIDIQLKGPYKTWEHSHKFQTHVNGTLIIDSVKIKIPFGLLGRIIAFAFITKDVKNIFKYRAEVISSIYNSNNVT